MKNYLLVILGLLCVQFSIAQDTKKEPPPFKMTRAEENYSYLKDKENSPYQVGVFDALKYIPFSTSGNTYLSIGGQIRPRFEHFSNRFWSPDADQDFYSQRLALHTNIVLNPHFRLFGELYHGYVSQDRGFAEYDEVDVFQAFTEIKIPFPTQAQLAIRVGRQEMGLGAARLIGIREGPNIRRSYDMGRLIYTKGKTKIQAFYGKEVIPLFEAFDNTFSLFDETAGNPQLWGAYSQFNIKNFNGVNELYYIGFQANNATFNDVIGDETRHTIGLRRHGKLGRYWKYNSEAIYQFGTIGTAQISAFSIDTDWHFEMSETQWKWSPGLKLEYTSGDNDANDGRINSFNPMFVNPAFYSLAATITPVNLIGIHPSVSIRPTKKLNLYVEWAIFWRASKNDGLYRPTRFVHRPADGIDSRTIGHQFGGKFQYELNRHVAFDLDISYFITSSFLAGSGNAENILHIAPTASFRF